MTRPSIVTEALDATIQGEVDLTTASVLGARIFVGIRFTDNSDVTVTPGAGTYTIDVKPLGMDAFQPITNGTDIAATASPISLDFAANAQSVRYTPTGVTVADLIKLTISSNE